MQRNSHHRDGKEMLAKCFLSSLIKFTFFRLAFAKLHSVFVASDERNFFTFIFHPRMKFMLHEHVLLFCCSLALSFNNLTLRNLSSPSRSCTHHKFQCKQREDLLASTTGHLHNKRLRVHNTSHLISIKIKKNPLWLLCTADGKSASVWLESEAGESFRKR